MPALYMTTDQAATEVVLKLGRSAVIGILGSDFSGSRSFCDAIHKSNPWTGYSCALYAWNECFSELIVFRGAAIRARD